MYVPMTPGRALASVVAMVPLLGLYFLIPQPAKVVDVSEVEATILSIKRSEMRQSFDGTTTTHVAQVELPDGGRARVWLAGRRYRSGDVIEVNVRQYEDGSRNVSPAY